MTACGEETRRPATHFADLAVEGGRMLLPKHYSAETYHKVSCGELRRRLSIWTDDGAPFRKIRFCVSI